jgi:hypothetical protein
MNKLLLIAAIAMTPSVALALGEGSARVECDGATVPTQRCPYPGNPFYQPSNNAFTGAIDRQPVVIERPARRPRR